MKMLKQIKTTFKNQIYDIKPAKLKNSFKIITLIDRYQFKRNFINYLISNNIKFHEVNDSLSSNIKTLIVKNYKFTFKNKNNKGSGGGVDVINNLESFQSSYLNIGFNYGIEWIHSLSQTTILLLNYLHDLNKYQSFHNISDNKITQLIYKKFNKLNKREKYFSNFNKCTPADIWIINKKYKFDIQEIENIQSLKQLKQLMCKFFIDKNLIGVSLKKIGNNAKLSIHNLEKKTYNFKNIFWSFNDDILSSKDIYLIIDNKFKIQFRTFNNLSGWQGEIKGQFANHGKIGGGVIFKILDNLNVNVPITPSTLNKHLKNKGIEEFLHLFIKYTNFNDIEKIKKKVNIDGLDWFYSKLLGFCLKYHLKDEKLLKTFATQILNYASSETDLSFPFIKIS